MEAYFWTADRAISYAAMKHHRDTVDARIAKASNRAKYDISIPEDERPMETFETRVDRAIFYLHTLGFPSCQLNIDRVLGGQTPYDQHEIDEL